MNFNAPIDRRNTNSSKWDRMETLYGVAPDDGLAMWTADSDYPTAPCVRDALQGAVDLGVFGYGWADAAYLNAIQWWMKTRHGWDIDTDWILSTQGLGHAIATSLDVWTSKGDAVAIFTPVYHEFANKIRKAGRVVTECPMVLDGARYVLDFADAKTRLTGKETMLIWCSPQNPSGRVWTADELRAVAAFAKENGMLLISDEIHHDLVYAGETFVPMHLAAPETANNTVYITAASKTFNIAGLRTGNMIIPDDGLRARMRGRLNEMDYQPNTMGIKMITAAYSPEGAVWADAQMDHLTEIRNLLHAGLGQIPGVRCMPLQATYLAWADFTGTGMSPDEITRRFRVDARIAASDGPTFGTGGAGFMRINFATQRHIVEEAVRRLQAAFADLQ
ncbi:MalY/PatB family protein [Yoonia sp.]|uniref:MalY/PatB family protein n=1 Tax=Yoonia sp. TaxID=2212373 RepID=UPI002FD98528